jgi:hypothetical protein
LYAANLDAFFLQQNKFGRFFKFVLDAESRKEQGFANIFTICLEVIDDSQIAETCYQQSFPLNGV